jgi:hypothetical protein
MRNPNLQVATNILLAQRVKEQTKQVSSPTGPATHVEKSKTIVDLFATDTRPTQYRYRDTSVFAPYIHIGDVPQEINPPAYTKKKIRIRRVSGEEAGGARGGPTFSLVREPDAANLHIRFDVWEVETGRGAGF